MKKMLLTLFAAAFTLFPKLLFSQTITGPTEVCPNTTVRYSWSGCPLGGSLTVVQDPGPYTIVAQGPQFIDLKFDPYSGTLPFILRGSCSGQFPQKDIKVISGISFTPPATESENVPCPKRGGV